MSLPNRIPALDGVRGLAILLVLMVHFTAKLQGNAWDVFWQGWAGLNLFFVLSGFLITGILLDTRDRPGCLRSFYWRRFLRIEPLYYLSLVVIFLVVGPGLGWSGEGQSWFWLYASNWRHVLELPPGGWSPHLRVGHFWSLAVEAQFYLVWPFVVIALGRRQLIRACACGVIAVLIARVVLAVGWGWGHLEFQATPFHIDAMMVGALISAWVREGHADRLAVAAGRCVWPLAAAFLVMCLAFDRWGVVSQTLRHTTTNLLCGAMLVLSLGRWSGAFEFAPLRWLGTYSYGLYVWHFPLFGWLNWWLFPTPPAGLLPEAGYVLAMLVVSAVAAVVSYHLFEVHFLRLKDVNFSRVWPGKVGVTVR